MSAPTPTKRDVAADLRQANGALVQACVHVRDAVVSSQTIGLPYGALLDLVDSVLALSDRLAKEADALEPAPKLELIPGGITSHGLCRHCGRIGDHGTACPEVSE